MSGTIYVTAGEVFSGTVTSGTDVVIEPGAQSDDATVFGTETVDAGASATGTTVEADGELANSGTVSDSTIEAGGTQIDFGLAVSNGDMVYGVERTTFDPSFTTYGTANNATIYSGGELFLTPGHGVDPTIAGGVLQDDQGGFPITFTTPGGVLSILPDSDLSEPITGFGPGDTVEIETYDTATPSFSVNGDVVTIVEPNGIQAGGYTQRIDIVGASQDQLILFKNQFGFVDLECVCFLAGTAIATPDGTRAIETLAVGDHVLTADGAARPVRWLGRQTVATRFADPRRTAPIRILAGALGENLPVRDLHVSPDHAIMVDGVFVQAGALVNGISITRTELLPETFVYYHVELADHALILAESVPAESFIDNVDRLAFDNWNEHAALDAATAPMTEMPHARAKAHRQVPPSLRRRLLVRAFALTACAAAA